MDQKNFIVAIVLSMLIIVGWQTYFPPAKPPVTAPIQNPAKTPAKTPANAATKAPLALLHHGARGEQRRATEYDKGYG